MFIVTKVKEITEASASVGLLLATAVQVVSFLLFAASRSGVFSALQLSHTETNQEKRKIKKPSGTRVPLLSFAITGSEVEASGFAVVRRSVTV